ncbi:phage/plasmid primase, P4 family [Chitinophaga sp. Hz27]|uniref:DNA primase family protein n=1 Tax=Chitinophaga sp. Hz27 TaxID=3347169 RepID=UPI0035D5AE61
MANENAPINPDFTNRDMLSFAKVEKSAITLESIRDHSIQLRKSPPALCHQDILQELLKKTERIDFLLLIYPEVAKLREQLTQLKDIPDEADKMQQEAIIRQELKRKKLSLRHYLVICIEEVLRLAKTNNWGLCKNHDFIYVYNGAFWSLLDAEELKAFLGEIAEKMGVDKYNGRHYQFREHLYKQFLSLAYLPSPKLPDDRIYVNLHNGTYEIGANGTRLRNFSRDDFITYQLPFSYNKDAQAPLFQRYLDTVLPDIQRQKVLAEYLGYLFIHPGVLKLEKALLLYGTGANGKSVFFEIVNALLGPQNVCSYSLQSLTDNTGYYRAKLANKLVNYASEINGSLEAAIFKQLASGEPVEARQPYGQAFNMTHYAKLIFNCNELPREVEHTQAYFRRFLIIPFDVTIPEDQQDKELSRKIITAELSGVFNWVLEGLSRLLTQKRFSECEAARLKVEEYKKQSDSVCMFLEDEGYKTSLTHYLPHKALFAEYRIYAADNGYRPCSAKTFTERLRQQRITVERKNIGMVVYTEK